MNKTWVIITKVIALILLVFATLKFFLLYTWYDNIRETINNSVNSYGEFIALGFMQKHHGLLITALLALGGCILLLMKKSAGWILAMGVFAASLFTLVKNVVWNSTSGSDENDLLFKAVVAGMVFGVPYVLYIPVGESHPNDLSDQIKTTTHNSCARDLSFC